MLLDFKQLDADVRKKFFLFVETSNFDRDLAVYLKVYQSLIDEILLFAKEELDEELFDRISKILADSSSLISQKKRGDQDPTVFLPAMIYAVFTKVLSSKSGKLVALNLRLTHQIDSLAIKYLKLI